MILLIAFICAFIAYQVMKRVKPGCKAETILMWVTRGTFILGILCSVIYLFAA